MALFLVLGLIAAACADGEGETVADGVAEAVAQAAEAEAAEEGLSDDETEVAPDEQEEVEAEEPEVAEEPVEGPPEPASDPIPLDFQFSEIEPGIYTVDEGGVPFTIDIEGQWWVQPNSQGFTVFSHPASQGPNDRDVVFLRPSALSDPSQPGADPDVQVGWPLDDLPGWLDNVIDGVITEPAVETQLGGRDALRFEAEVRDRSVCGTENFCVGFATNNLVNSLAFEIGSKAVVYWVDMGDQPPMAVFIGSPSNDDDWEATAEELLATIEFGEPGPHPIDIDAGELWEQGFDSEVPAGLQQFPTFGGIQFELDEERLVAFASDSFMFVEAGEGIPADIELWSAVADSEGMPIESTDELFAALEPLVNEVEEVGTSTYPLGEAREFDVTVLGQAGFDTGIYTQADGVPWGPPPAGRLWVFETERGIIVVSAESFEGDTFVDQMIEIAEATILPSLELIDLG